MAKQKKTKKTELSKEPIPQNDVIEGEVVSGKDIEWGSDTVKFNDVVRIISGFYKNEIGKVISRQKTLLGDKIVFSYRVLLDSIDLVEVFEKEIKVLSE